MRIRPKPIEDPLVRTTADALYRGNHVPKVTSWLDGLGLTEARRRWHVGAAYIATDADRWVPAEPGKGRLAVCCPALSPDMTPWLDDLIAFFPDRPRHWFFYSGQGAILGRDIALPFGLPVTVWRDPLEWARAAGEGIAILNPARAWPYLTGRGDLTLASQSQAHGLAIEHALQVPVVLPKIVVQVAT